MKNPAISTSKIVLWFIFVWPVGLQYLLRRMGVAKGWAITTSVGALVALFIVIGATGNSATTTPLNSGVSDSATSAPAPAPAAPAKAAPAKAAPAKAAPAPVAPAPVAPDPAPAEPSLTASQQNATDAAKNYLSFAAFSRTGLIQQLSSSAGDGYPEADATFAVDSLNANWNEQAAKAAKNYLSFSSFSRAGLIQQLNSSAGDGYTYAQAVYGVNQTGL
jgi:hypothetical protein